MLMLMFEPKSYVAIEVPCGTKFVLKEREEHSIRKSRLRRIFTTIKTTKYLTQRRLSLNSFKIFSHIESKLNEYDFITKEQSIHQLRLLSTSRLWLYGYEVQIHIELS